MKSPAIGRKKRPRKTALAGSRRRGKRLVGHGNRASARYLPLPLWEREGPTEGGKVRGAACTDIGLISIAFLPAFRP